MSRGSYLTRSLRFDRATSALSAGDPVSQAEQMNAIGAQCALFLRQEGEPKAHAILWHSERDLAFVIFPQGNRRSAKPAVDRLMIGTHDFERHGSRSVRAA